MKTLSSAVMLCASVTLVGTATAQTVPALHRVGIDESRGTAASVRVADVPLAFTGQVFAHNVSGDARAQSDDALRGLGEVLVGAGAELSGLARLTAYVADDRSVAAVEQSIATHFARMPPAFTLVRTPLPVPDALVAFEAVAVSSRSPRTVEVVDANVAIVPAGGKIFISGQAERGTNLAAAVKLTMAGLHRSITHLGLKKSDIVQVKAFIKPFGEHDVARREVAASFDGGRVPPTVIYEWVSELFTEIEIVVSATSLPATAGEPITYAWLPWHSKSPRFSHVTHVMPGTPLIFIGAIDGGDANDPRTQMKVIFERLGSVLFEAGSSYRNMAKATYYLSDRTARALLGDIRGVYYDPTRPPAASAVGVQGHGYPGRAAMLDMIAVPVK